MLRNAKLFYLIAEALEERPDLHDQTRWFGVNDDDGYDLQEVFVAGRQVTCGTTQCIAGWAIALEGAVLGVDDSQVDPEVGGRDGEFVAVDGRHAGLDLLTEDQRAALSLSLGRGYDLVAAQLLGLSAAEADRLFYELDPFDCIDWPAALRDIGDGADVEEALLRHGATTPEERFGGGEPVVMLEPGDDDHPC